MTNQAGMDRQKHVLVVDDEVELAQAYQELLQMHGYRVTVANDGVQALKFINQAEVDAIFCDLSMPELEGDMFYNAVLHVRPELAPCFIFVTGHANHPKYEAFLKKSSARVLYKPVPLVELLDALSNLFRQST